jgi:hypothetical protein
MLMFVLGLIVGILIPLASVILHERGLNPVVKFKGIVTEKGTILGLTDEEFKRSSLIESKKDVPLEELV